MNKVWKRMIMSLPKSFIGSPSFPKVIRKQLCEADKPRATQEHDIKKPFGYTGI